MEGNQERNIRMMPGLTYTRLRDACQRQGYPFFDAGDFNLNIIGLRTNDNRGELFNDWLFVAFRQNDHEQLLAFQITTDPGTYWLEHPMNVKGTAIVKPGHYPKLWSLGRHKNQYPALVQTGQITVYRDNDKNDTLDMTPGTEQKGHYGINLHRAGRLTDARSKIGRWSAGCQVFQSGADFELFLAIVRRAGISWGDQYSYSLLTESQLWGKT